MGGRTGTFFFLSREVWDLESSEGILRLGPHDLGVVSILRALGDSLILVLSFFQFQL